MKVVFYGDSDAHFNYFKNKLEEKNIYADLRSLKEINRSTDVLASCLYINTRNTESLKQIKSVENCNFIKSVLVSFDNLSKVESMLLEKHIVAPHLDYLLLPTETEIENSPFLEDLMCKTIGRFSADIELKKTYEITVKLSPIEKQAIKSFLKTEESTISICAGTDSNLPFLETILKSKNISPIFTDLNSHLPHESRRYLLTNAHALMTAPECEYLKKHPYTEGVIIYRPDFDEYEDTIGEFKKKFPKIQFYFYDDYIYDKNSGTQYCHTQSHYLEHSFDLLLKKEQLIRAKKVGQIINQGHGALFVEIQKIKRLNDLFHLADLSRNNDIKEYYRQKKDDAQIHLYKSFRDLIILTESKEHPDFYGIKIQDYDLNACHIPKKNIDQLS